MTLISIEAEYVSFSACKQVLIFLSMVLGEITKLKKPYIIYEDIQGESFLEQNRQVGVFRKYIDIQHHFLRDMVEDKDFVIQYIWSEDTPGKS